MDIDVKQVVVVRKDVQLRRGKMASLVAQASMMFLIDNDDSERGDRVSVALSPTESAWLTGSAKIVVLAIDSEDALESLVLRAQLAGVEVHEVSMMRGNAHGQRSETVCVAMGPCESTVLDGLTSTLKSL